MDTPHREYILPLQRMNIRVAGYACSMGLSAPIASTFPCLLMPHALNLALIYFRPTAGTEGLGSKQKLVFKGTHLALHILSIILSVYIAGRSFILQSQRRVSNLRRQTVFKIQQARLTDIFYFCTSLANNGGFESHALAWIPTEHGERPSTCTAGSSVFLF